MQPQCHGSTQAPPGSHSSAQPHPPCRFLASRDARPRRSEPLSGTAAAGGSTGADNQPAHYDARKPFGWQHAAAQVAPAWLTDHLDALAAQPRAQPLEFDAAAGEHAGLHRAAHQRGAHHLHAEAR